MTAVKVKLPVIEQGATYSHTIRWLNPDKTTPVDLTGATAQMQVRETIDSIDTLIELSSGNGRVAIDVLTGTISLSIASADTTLLTPVQDAVYDLEIHYPDHVVRLIEGKITIKGEVTRG